MAFELKEMKEYWKKKYPHVHVTLWNNHDETEFFGKIIAHQSSIDLKTQSIGELINQGELFLRKASI